MSKIELILSWIILVVCLVLGTGIAIWTTGVQGEFLHELGVSRWGAMTIEPLLIIVSFLLGIRITRTHRAISLSFLVILFGISLITMVSMYTKKSFTVLESSKQASQVLVGSAKNEELIRDSLKGLSDRGTTSSKSITKAIDQLQKQQDKTEKIVKSETLELKSIIETISSLMQIEEKNAVLLFSFFVSLAAVFSPSFLFFSAGMMIRNTGMYDVATNQIQRMIGLSLKQKIILLAKEHVSNDVEEIAKFLKTSPTVVRAQLTRIDKKLSGEDVGEDEDIKI